ncbi:MAG TPA: S1/P1 nuclease [Burkholderiaceae bacterium]
MPNKSTLARAVLALGLAAAAAPSFAWNGFGHMVVADVAYRDLKANAPQLLARIDALLELNPDHAKWISGVAKSSQEEVAFVQAAHWADDIKRPGSGYYADGADNGNVGVEPVSSYDLGYAPNDTAMHKYWHFIDQGFSPDGTPVPATPTPNAEDRIALFAQTLASGEATDALKSYDLVWLIHLVGDLHQPLHATDRFTADAPNGDAGGNLVKVSCAGNCPGELHAVWDDILGTSTSAGAAISYAATLAIPTGASVRATDDVWAAESLRMAEKDAYAGIGSETTGTHRLSASYLARARADARRRVALAGARLSYLIQQNLR